MCGDVEARQFTNHFLDFGSVNYSVCKEPEIARFFGPWLPTTQELNRDGLSDLCQLHVFRPRVA